MTIPRVLVLYPEEFACRPKFDRKLDSLLANKDEYQLAYFDDPRGFVEARRDTSKCADVTKVQSFDGVTHAIVFGDAESFTDELNALKELGIPCRLVRIKITRVINIRREERYSGQRSTPAYEYIGRGSDWGNPYSMFDASDESLSSRDEVIRKYAYDFDRGLLKRKKQDALRLAGKRLGCFCKPDACHGDVIAEYLNSMDDGK